MAEFGFLVNFAYLQLDYIKIIHEQQSLRYLKWPLLGCAVALAVGCSAISSQQTADVRHSYQPPAKTSINTKEPESTLPRQKWELAIPDHSSVDTWVQRFSQDKQKSFQTQLYRAPHYVVPAQEIFEQAGLPKDLVYVALVESGFTPTARSHASAVGMWQFISSTGKRYGLDQNKWVDERRHPFKSARAAADYLSFLYDTFGSWELALAAYNTGENGVQRALDQSGLKTFWELADNGYLPAETRDYVPKVLATVKIIRNPEHYGFYFDPRQYTPKNETVTVPGGIKLGWLEKRTGIPESTLRDHNPELTKHITPPSCSDYELCVPIGAGETILTALSEHSSPNEKPAVKSAASAGNVGPPERATIALKKDNPKSALKASGTQVREKDARGGADRNTIPTVASYTVKAGDTLTGIAKKSGCSAKALAALNRMNTNQPLKVGQALNVLAKDTINVAASKRETPQKSAVRSSKNKTSTRQTQKSRRPVYYSIRQGDTLWSIAERFKISVDKLCSHNELNPSQKLIPGNVLTISTKERESSGTPKKRSN
ncbi:MAG: LysM peptidoglycan-binding domain-containing protein [Syntrophobacteraceae bacterium]